MCQNSAKMVTANESGCRKGSLFSFPRALPILGLFSYQAKKNDSCQISKLLPSPLFPTTSLTFWEMPNVLVALIRNYRCFQGETRDRTLPE